jgi:hypothetical protein
VVQWILHPLPLIRRLLVSAGTREVTPQEADTLRYDLDAILPRPPWRVASNEESARLTARGVSLVSFPALLVGRLTELGLAGVCNQRDAHLFCERHDVRRALNDLVECATRMVSRTEDMRVQGMSVRAPGLLTTTVDPSRDRRIGIHIDSWDRLSIPARAKARNRLNINLGTEPRYLLLVDAPIDEMPPADAIQGSVNATAFAKDYLRTNPNVPVMQLEIRPGEAYMAPTERLPHDSTTAMKQAPDISFTILGHFVMH